MFLSLQKLGSMLCCAQRSRASKVVTNGFLLTCTSRDDPVLSLWMMGEPPGMIRFSVLSKDRPTHAPHRLRVRSIRPSSPLEGQNWCVVRPILFSPVPCLLLAFHGIEVFSAPRQGHLGPFRTVSSALAACQGLKCKTQEITAF